MLTINLDISRKGIMPVIHAKQGEVGRKFKVVVTDAGVPYVIPDDALLSVWYSGNTDEGNYSSIEDRSAFTVEDNNITVELVSQMLQKPGGGNLCLTVSGADGTEISTWNIPYYVEFKPGAGSAAPTVYYTAFSEIAASAAKSAYEAQKAAEDTANNIFSLVYPVGSIYMSVNEMDPAGLFGGKWERLKDTFLLAAGDTYAAGSTGGEAVHTLTEAEMPNHVHDGVTTDEWADSHRMTYDHQADTENGDAAYWSLVNSTDPSQYTARTVAAGGSEAHNNMPPYLAVYVWKRIA